MRDDLERMLAFPAKLIPTSVIVPAWRRLTDGESTWPVLGAVIVATGLQVALPNQYEIPPNWLLPTLGALLGIGFLIAHPHRITRHSPQVRIVSIMLIAVITLANAGSAGRLINALLQGKAENVSATSLLLTGGAIWLTNVIVFGMWYWNLDRGGPAARAQAMKPFPDFLFPQMTAPGSGAGRLAAAVLRLPLPVVHQRRSVQPHRHAAVGALGEDGDDAAVDRVTRHGRAGRRSRRQHLEMTAWWRWRLPRCRAPSSSNGTSASGRSFNRLPSRELIAAKPTTMAAMPNSSDTGSNRWVFTVVFPRLRLLWMANLTEL